MQIVGITGTLWSGKWTIVDYLIKKYWFQYFSVRVFLIKEVEKRWLPLNRDSMALVANDLRASFGPSYIVEQLYEEAKLTWKNTIIESIRAVGEVEALQKKWDFLLYAIDADIKIRYQRILLRSSETDNVSFEEFVANEEREMQNTDPNKQNISLCMKMADHLFDNNGSLDDLYHQIDTVVSHI